MGNKHSEILLSITLLKHLCRYVSFRGLNPEEILRYAVLKPALLLESDGSIRFDRYIIVQNRAAEILQDEHFGLHLGEYADPMSWSVLGYIMMNCATLGEALQKAERYVRIVGNLITWKIVYGDKYLSIVMTIPGNEHNKHRHCVETTTASIIRNISMLTGSKISPHRVDLSTPCIGSADEYWKAFNCPIRFSQAESVIKIPNSLLEMPILHANKEHLRYFERYAQNLLEKKENDNTFSNKVGDIIVQKFSDGEFMIPDVASELSISPRTLQYKLAEEGYTFRTLVSAVREKLARRYLEDNHSVDDISYMLGFSEPSVFRRSFKRWTGSTPGEYKRKKVMSDPNITLKNMIFTLPPDTK